jgi:hypothetical protein
MLDRWPRSCGWDGLDRVVGGCRGSGCRWHPDRVEIEDPGGRLSDAELGDLMRLLARFASHDLDQWENWRIQTSYGPVYVLITNALPPDWPDEAFTTTWPLPPHLAEGRTEGWTVWRQDDSGNQYVVSRHDTRAEAQAVATDMEARGHKQVYWVTVSD